MKAIVCILSMFTIIYLALACNCSIPILEAIFIEQIVHDPDKWLKRASLAGRKYLVDACVAREANDWNRGMVGATKGNHKELVDFFISKGAKGWDWSMYYAAQGNHKELVDFFHKKMEGN